MRVLMIDKDGKVWDDTKGTIETVPSDDAHGPHILVREANLTGDEKVLLIFSADELNAIAKLAPMWPWP